MRYILQARDAIWLRASRFLIPLVLVLNSLAALALGVYSYLNPLGNWDIIPYVALVRAVADDNPASLSRKTYRDVRDYLGDEKYLPLVSGSDENSRYRITLYQVPAALIDNLRFYSVKPLYVFLSRQVTFITGNAAAATVMVSSAAFCFFVALFPLFFQWPVLAVAAIWPLILTGAPAFRLIAASTTPDSLGMLLAVSATLMAVANRHLAFVGLLALLGVLARPDAIFIFMMLFCGLAWQHRKDGKAPALLLCALLVSFLFLFLNSHALPWSTLFRHTFFEHQAYPSLLSQPVSVAEYIGVVTRTLTHVASPRAIFFLSSGCLLAVVPWLRNRSVTPPQFIAAIAVVNMVAHYMIFPIDEYGHERMFSSSYFLILAALMMALQAAWVRKSGRAK